MICKTMLEKKCKHDRGLINKWGISLQAYIFPFHKVIRTSIMEMLCSIFWWLHSLLSNKYCKHEWTNRMINFEEFKQYAVIVPVFVIYHNLCLLLCCLASLKSLLNVAPEFPITYCPYFFSLYHILCLHGLSLCFNLSSSLSTDCVQVTGYKSYITIRKMFTYKYISFEVTIRSINCNLFKLYSYNTYLCKYWNPFSILKMNAKPHTSDLFLCPVA